MSELLQSYLIILVETFCCLIFFETFVDSSKQRRGIFSSGMPVVFCLSLLSLIIAVLLDSYGVIRQVVDMTVTAWILSHYFRERFRKCLLLSVLFAGLLWAADYIVILLYPALILHTTENQEIKYFFLIMLSKLLLFLVLIILNGFMSSNDIKYIKTRDWLLFLILPFFSIFITSAFIKNIEMILGTELETTFIVLAWGLIGMNIAMFYFMRNIGRRENLLHEKELFELETQNKLQLYEAISERAEDQRKLSHEYKNQITCMQSLCEKGEYDRLKEYLAQISGETLHDMDYIDTNHIFVNAVLNTKYQEALQKKILVICKVNDLSQLTMEGADLVVLLSNVLNNAIEACEKCRAEQILKLKCVYEDGDFILSVRNTYDGKLKKIGDFFGTTKADHGRHGIGLKNVIAIIEKNQGYYAVEHSEKEFQISIVIPQETH